MVLELAMARRKGPETVVDKAEASKTADVMVAEAATGAVEAVATAAVAHLVIIKPRAPEPHDEEVVLQAKGQKHQKERFKK